MVDYSGPDLGLRAAQMPTLLDEIHRKTIQRAQISQTTRAEDAAQRTQRAYQMLEGIDEQPSIGYGSLFGQRASGQNEFRTVDDAAAYLRATDPAGMTTRQTALGEFMANQALPRLTTVTDPAQRVAVLREMAASGPPMLNRLLRDIGEDGVMTDEELAQAEGMYGSYRKAAESPWRVAGSNLVNLDDGTFRAPPVPESQAAYDFGGEAKNLAEAYRALSDENAPPAVKQAARAFIADYEAQTSARRRSNLPPQGGGSAPRAAAAPTPAQELDGPYVTDRARDLAEASRIFNDANSTDAERLAASALLGTAATGGTVADRFNSRVIQGANLATAAIEKVVDLPMTADTGFFGSGDPPGGRTLLDATGQWLRNEISSADQQAYNVMMAGVLRNLAIIETSGLAPTGSFTDSMGAVLFRPGDDTSGLTRMRKLAEMRQTVEEGVKPLIAGRASREQKAFMREIIARIARAVPFTHDDITRYQRALDKNPKLTYREWARSVAPRRVPRRLDSGAALSQPFGTPAAPLNIRPTAPAAPAGGNPTVDWNDL